MHDLRQAGAAGDSVTTKVIDLRTPQPPSPAKGRGLVLASSGAAVVMTATLAIAGGLRMASPTDAPKAQDPAPPPAAPEQAPAPAPEADPVALGRRLFFDRNLSANRDVSCATCHRPDRAYTSGGRAPKLGGGLLELRAPTLLDRAAGTRFMWDGRAATLEEQALMPITNPNEMGLPIDEAVRRAGVRDATELAGALAAFERTITHTRTAFDDFLDGRNANVDPEVARGWQLFRGKAHCAACHTGPNLTDDRLHETFFPGRKFKTPGLRNVRHALPYMHDGSVRYLSDVIDRYDRGGGETQPLHLSDREKDDLRDLLLGL